MVGFRKIAGLVFVISLFLSMAVMSHAEIPRIMNYQGYLTDTNDAPVNRVVAMMFSLYDVIEGGTPLWSESREVSVADGIYNVNLGELIPVCAIVCSF